jgi:hypothetical protein
MAIWKDAGDPGGTLVEEYLTTRALRLPPDLRGRVIRFHRACPSRNKQTDKIDFIPAMIVAFTSTTGDEVTAIHRIRLDRPERWPRTERMMLGVTAGAAIKLDAIGDGKLAIGPRNGAGRARARLRAGLGTWIGNTNQEVSPSCRYRTAHNPRRDRSGKSSGDRTLCASLDWRATPHLCRNACKWRQRFQ